MKAATSELVAHLAGEVTTLATCWKITRRDSVVLGFTDHIRDLEIDGVTYQAASGYTRTAIRSTADLAVDNLDVESVFSDDGITEADMRAGKYDFAEIRMFPATTRSCVIPMPNPDPDAIVATARSWLGTPWIHQGRLKGVGVDCGGLIIGVGKQLGLLDFDTSAYGRISDGQRLRVFCDEHLFTKPIDEIVPGDVLLMRFTRHPQHLAIVGDRGDPFSLIHAYADAGRCVEHGADPKWHRRIVAAYSFKPSKT